MLSSRAKILLLSALSIVILAFFALKTRPEQEKAYSFSQTKSELVYPHLHHSLNYFNHKHPLTEVILKNGMRLYLAHTGKRGKVTLRLIAKGGSNALFESERDLSKILVKGAIESGAAKATRRNLSQELYKLDADFSIEITSYSRSITANFYASDLEFIAELIHSVFTHPSFTYEGYQAALDLLQNEKIEKDKTDFNHSFVSSFEEFERCRILYREAFSDPEEFICVLTGDLDPDAALEPTKKIFEKIPRIPQSFRKQLAWQHLNTREPQLNSTYSPKIHVNGSEGVIVLTLPLKKTIDADSFPYLEISCRTAEKRLKKRLKLKNTAAEMSVSYEFPFYPLQINPLVIIRYDSRADHDGNLLHKLKTELSLMQEIGFDEEEINSAKRSFYKEFLALEKDPLSLALVLSDYAFWGWRPAEALLHADKAVKASPKEINLFLQEYFDSGNINGISRPTDSALF